MSAVIKVKAQKKSKNSNAPRRKRKNNTNAASASLKAMPMSAPLGRVTAPVATTYVRKVKQPKITYGKLGDVTVEREELVATLNGSVDFVNTTFNVNPGLGGTFPWLAQMAALYDSYRFESLRFDYQPESSSMSTGSVMLAVDYDPSDPPATSKQQLASYRGYVRAAPWCPCSNVSIREDLNKRTSYNVRSGSLSANQDIKLYDAGVLNFATSGQADTAVVGELYVSYRVKFMTPHLANSGLGSALSSRYTASSLAGAYSTVVGNAPVIASGTVNLATFTATQPYQALVTLSLVGTGMGGTATTGSTAAVTTASLNTDGGTANQVGVYVVNFREAGETFVSDVVATTITAASARFAQYAASNQ